MPSEVAEDTGRGGIVMDFSELARERYSVRKFDGRKVEAEKLNAVLEAGRLAPTACNFQPQRTLVLDAEESLEKLKNCTPYHFSAPVALIVCYDNTVSWKRSFDGKDMGEVDASIVVTHMMLEAANVGLGSTWVGHFDPAKLRAAYALPDNLVPVAILPMGYPHETSVPSAKHEERRALRETTFRNAVGNPY